MIDALRGMAIFAETVRQGSFRGAARVLGLSPSVVSYHVSQLEQQVGTALIYRSTRRLSLTGDGQRLYQHCQQMLAAAQQGLSEVSADSAEPGGKLTITLPSALSRSPLAMQIAGFIKRYPQIELNVLCTDERQNLIEQGIDLAIRAGGLEDSGLKTRRIGHVSRTLVCAPDYLAGRAIPHTPEQLDKYSWIRLAMLPDRRTLIGPQGQTEDIRFAAQTTVNSVELMTQFCIQGLGVATPPDFLVQDALEAGQLVELLPEWSVQTMPLYALWPANVAENANARRLLTHLDEAAGGGLDDT